MRSAGDVDATTTPAARLAAFEADGGTAADVLALFDSLPSVAVEAILGRWRGSGLPSGHPINGLLAG